MIISFLILQSWLRLSTLHDQVYQTKLMSETKKNEWVDFFVPITPYFMFDDDPLT